MLVELSVGRTGAGRTRWPSPPVGFDDDENEFARDVGRRCCGVVGVRSPLRCDEKLKRPSADVDDDTASSCSPDDDEWGAPGEG